MKTIQTSQQTGIATLRKYVRYWPFIMISFVFSLCIVYLYLKTQVPRYKITSTLLLQDDSKGDGLFKGTAFSDLNLFGTRKTVYDEMELIRSRDLIYKVLQQLNLQTNYSYEHPAYTEELYGSTLPLIVETLVLKPGASGLQVTLKPLNNNKFLLTEKTKKTIYNYGNLISRPQFIIRVRRGPAKAYTSKSVFIKFINLHNLAQAYSTTGLVVLPVIKDANTVVITLIDALPERGVAILKTLLELYNTENINSKNRIALQTISFINTKLKGLSSNLSGAEKDIEQYKVKNQITELNEDAQVNLQNSGAFQAQLAATNVQLNMVNSIKYYLNSNSDRYALVPTTLGLKDPTLQNLTERYNTLQIERQRLLRNNSAVNPLVVTLSDQLSGLRKSLLENLTMIRKGILLEKDNLQHQNRISVKRTTSIPVMERGLLERSREQVVKTTQYQYLLQKREETELSLSATISSFQVVDKPAYNPQQTSPKVQLLYLIGLMAGIGAPIGLVYVKEIFNDKVRETTDAAYIAENVKILGELSHKPLAEEIVVERGKSTNISELFRYIRSNLQFMRTEKLNKVVLVTSTSKGEGKTFVSINLGITLSLTGKKVVILEFDLRKPDLLSGMKISSDYGLSNYLSGQEIRVTDMLIPVPDSEDLYVIGCGQIPKDPDELLSSHRLPALMEELKQRFDYIIIDSPPVNQFADAFALGQFADASIYLVRYNYTTKADLSIFTEIAENKRLKNPLIVFNDARRTNKTLYRYGR